LKPAWTLVLRHGGERTHELSLRYHARLFPNTRICVTGSPTRAQVDNLPDLVSAVAEAGTPVLVLDSDIFLARPELILELIDKVEAGAHHIKAALQCRFLGPVYRGALLFSAPMGAALRRAYASHAWDQPSFILRPLRTIIELAMAELRCDSTQDFDPRIAGVHDYAQYRCHLFHKLIYRGWREDQRQMRSLAEQWQTSTDLDLRVAASGLEYSFTRSPTHLGYAQIQAAFEKLNIPEKQPVVSASEWREIFQNTSPHLPWSKDAQQILETLE